MFSTGTQDLLNRPRRFFQPFRFNPFLCLLLSFCLLLLGSGLHGQSDCPNGFQFQRENNTTITLLEKNQPVWTYVFGFKTGEHVPEQDSRRIRSCYIHPLYGIRGEVLTDDFPTDHYHHHGVFWTWPHVGMEETDGNQVDLSLWEDKGIKQQFVRWIDQNTTEDVATLSVENGWFLEKKGENMTVKNMTNDTESPNVISPEKIMSELVTIKTGPTQEDPILGKTRSIDLEFTWIPLKGPITLRGAEGKSYGGLTVRFRPYSRETTITVPQGVAVGDLSETPLEWADFTSRFGESEQRSGAVIFVPPTHPDFPPTWLTRYYGPLCVGWPGVNGKTFQPGEPIQLHYRIWIHENSLETEQIQTEYEQYSREFGNRQSSKNGETIPQK
ncbi:MAG: DUF6807 family protein [Thermoguttaceae bacterium]